MGQFILDAKLADRVEQGMLGFVLKLLGVVGCDVLVEAATPAKADPNGLLRVF